MVVQYRQCKWVKLLSYYMYCEILHFRWAIFSSTFVDLLVKKKGGHLQIYSNFKQLVIWVYMNKLKMHMDSCSQYISKKTTELNAHKTDNVLHSLSWHQTVRLVSSHSHAP